VVSVCLMSFMKCLLVSRLVLFQLCPLIWFGHCKHCCLYTIVILEYTESLQLCLLRGSVLLGIRLINKNSLFVNAASYIVLIEPALQHYVPFKLCPL
jgi:hypothetical protein